MKQRFALWKRARRLHPALRALVVFGFVAALLIGPRPAALARPAMPERSRTAPMDLPLAFTPNVGQYVDAVRFQARNSGGALFFTSSAVVLALHDQRQTNKDERAPDQSIVQLRFEDANAAVTITSAERLPGVVNDLRGNDPAAWRTGIPTFASITYRQLYPGVDLRYEGSSGQIKGTYTVAPGADPARIRWRYAGAEAVRVDAARGDLVIPVVTTSPGRRVTLSERAPVAWQDVGGRRVPIQARYVLYQDQPTRADGRSSFVVRHSSTIGFALGSYDRARPLVIDPVLVYSTYLGGSSGDEGRSIAVDQSGNAYVTGVTWSDDFPGAGLPQPGFGGGDCGTSACYDAFVAKISADGRTLLYSTYLGGSGWDEGHGIAVDASGSALIAGTTGSRNFPLWNALQPSYGGSGGSPVSFFGDAFVTKLSPDGRSFVYSTYLGGSFNDQANSIAADRDGNAYLAGATLSSDFLTVNPAQPTFGGGTCYRQDPCYDGFVAKLSADGQALLYSTYLGGTDEDHAESIAIDRAGNAYVTGMTRSPDFPTRQALQPTHAGERYSYDAFVAKYDPNGGVAYSTYLGGSDNEQYPIITVDSAGHAGIAGITFSSDFPTEKAAQATYGGGTCGNMACADVFMSKLNADGRSFVYSTYLGGSSTEGSVGLVTDGHDTMVLVLTTSSPDLAWRDFARLPAALPCSTGQYGENVQYVVLTFTADDVFIESGPFSFSRQAYVRDIALDAAGALYLVGGAGGVGMPTVNAIQPNGDSDAFVTKIDLDAAPGRALWPPPYDGAYANQSFRDLWERTDMPVANGLARRSWVWGPEPITAGFPERNSDSPDGLRTVQYFDKSRMEVNDPNAPPGPWYVTNGLLVEEMIVGSIQVGSQSFEPCAPSEEAVAGDPAAENANAPTYRSFRDWSFPLNQDRAPDRRGQTVTAVLSKDGLVSDNPDLARYAVTNAYYEPQIGRNIPKVFTDFFGQQGVIFENQHYTTGSIIQDWVYVVGLPLSEPYWLRARVGGAERDVLVQVFERRVLTYAPDNPPEWRVEMGNVGRHYLHWRYGLVP